MNLFLSVLFIWEFWVLPPQGVVSFSSTVRFATPSSSFLQQQQRQQRHLSAFVFAATATDDNEEEEETNKPAAVPTSNRMRKRLKRKRKKQTTATPAAAAAAESEEAPVGGPQFELKPRDSSKVRIQITDIRDVGASGATSNIIREEESTPPPAPTAAGFVRSDNYDDRIRDTTKIPAPGPDNDLGFDYEMLLRDAALLEKQEQNEEDGYNRFGVGDFGDVGDDNTVLEEDSNFFSKLFFLGDSNKNPEDEKQKKNAVATTGTEEEAGNLPSIGTLISYIVTADFFVVLLLLGWFAAGIAQSAFFNVQTVQIAFNNNFERIVQPALGILMIGSASSALMKEEDE